MYSLTIHKYYSILDTYYFTVCNHHIVTRSVYHYISGHGNPMFNGNTHNLMLKVPTDNMTGVSPQVSPASTVTCHFRFIILLAKFLGVYWNELVYLSIFLAVYNLRMCMKEDNPRRTYSQGDL